MDENVNREYESTPEQPAWERPVEETERPAQEQIPAPTPTAPSWQPYAETPAPAQEPEKKKKGSGKWVALAVIAILLCAAAFVGGLFLGKGTNRGLGTVAEPTESSSGKKNESEPTESAFEFETQESDEKYNVKTVAAMTMDGVVEITTETVTTGSFFGQYVSTGAGSGVIIREDGIIVTNNHVIEDASHITVRLRSGEEYEATLLGTDEENDVALLHIDAEGLTAVAMGKSSKLTVGDEVVAIGNPLGSLGGTVTNGIISALEREITIEGQSMTLLQTNAAINPGNSGGGLFNASGELIGIVNAKSSGENIEGLGFAIPIDTAKPVIEDLLNYGYVRGKVKLGISLLDIYTDSYVRYYGVPEMGTYVSDITEDGDADKAGLLSGDRIKRVNGKEVTSKEDITNVLKDASVGDTVTFDIVRYTYSSGWRATYTEEELTVKVTLTEYRSGNHLIR